MIITKCVRHHENCTCFVLSLFTPRVCSSDDIEEVGLEGSATDEETIDIGLLEKISGVFTVDRTTILNTGLSADFLRHILAQPATDKSMSILSNFRSSSLTSSNCPNRLIGNDDAAPVLYRALECFKLSLQDIIGLLSLSLSKGLTDANNRVETNFLSLRDLGSDQFIGLTVVSSSLRVTDNDPVDIEIFQLVSADFTGESTLSASAHVLTGNLDLSVEQSLHGSDMNGDRSDDNFELIIAEGSLVEDIVDKILDGLDSTVALPVTTDDHLSLGSFTFHFVCFSNKN